jgi:hypothetical protein
MEIESLSFDFEQHWTVVKAEEFCPEYSDCEKSQYFRVSSGFVTPYPWIWEKSEGVWQASADMYAAVNSDSEGFDMDFYYIDFEMKNMCAALASKLTCRLQNLESTSLCEDGYSSEINYVPYNHPDTKFKERLEEFNVNPIDVDGNKSGETVYVCPAFEVTGPSFNKEGKEIWSPRLGAFSGYVN